MKLYELTDQLKVLNDLIESGEVSKEDVQTALDQLEGEVMVKIEDIGKFILSLNSDVAQLSEELSRLQRRKTALQNTVDWLKEYLLNEMTASNIPKVKSAVVTVSVQPSPPSCVVVDETKVPDSFKRVIPEMKEVDKKLIIDSWKEDGSVPEGIQIIDDKKHVRVR